MSNEQPRTRFRWALVGVAALGIVVCLIAAEVALRIVTPGPPFPTAGERSIRLREHPPGLDVFRSPPADRVAGADGLTDRRVQFSTDGDGFIRPSTVHPDPDRTIVFLGGSTTECYYVADSLRFHALVASDLGRRLGLRVNALNSGHAGNHSLHSLALLQGTVIPRAPDAVVMMHNVNDLVTLLHEGSYWNGNPSRSLVLARSCERAACRAQRGVAALSASVFPALTYRLGRIRPRPEFEGTPAVPDSLALTDAFRRSLVTFVRTARSWDIEPVLMTQASRFTPDAPAVLGWGDGIAGLPFDTFRARFDAFNAVTRSVADSLGVPLVDLASRIPADRTHLYDYVHLTDAGSRRAARIITDVLESVPAVARGRKRRVGPPR